MSQEKDSQNSQNKEALMNLGAWLGRHQAFGLIANRCSAADAECLKAIRDGGEYKQLGLTWEQFCGKHAGVSRVYADRQIHCLEEFGGNYFRFADVMPISQATYRLIAGAVSDQGLECNGERIPLVRENRGKVAAAIEAMRAKPQTKSGAGAVSEQGTLWVGSGLPALPQHQRFLAQREGEPMQALAALFEHADQFQPAVGLIGDAVRLAEQRIQPFAKRTHFRAGASLGLRLGAHLRDGGDDLLAVLADQRDAFAIAFEALVGDRARDQPVGLR